MNEVLRNWTPKDVQDAPTYNEQFNAFANYAHQKAGTPYPTLKDGIVSKKLIKQFFKDYPEANWFTVCRVVDFVRARKKRPARLQTLIAFHRHAWSAGFLPELDPREIPVDETVDRQVEEILAQEERPGWRRRFLLTLDPEKRKELVEEWQAEHRSSNSQ